VEGAAAVLDARPTPGGLVARVGGRAIELEDVTELGDTWRRYRPRDA
jgi:hypothetical protein